jgi:propionyl-CoA carboxylase alpha chain
MNTRLQVEHRVTELITGIDLVEQMIRIADGEKMPFTQEQVQHNGWAMEARIYAEDPKRGFLPSSGRITRYAEPENVPDILIDTGVYEGGEVSMFYDPMVAKVCSHAPNRAQAIEKLQQALSAFVLRGIEHNMSFLEAILAHSRFAAGDITTRFIEQEYPGGFGGADLTDESTRVFIGASLAIYLRDAERAARITGQLPGRQRAIGARWVVNVDDKNYSVFVRVQDDGYQITYDRDIITVRTAWKLGRRLFQGYVNGKSVSVKIRNLDEGYVLTYGGSDVTVKVRTPRIAELAEYMPKARSTDRKDKLKAPIAGLIVSIRVKVGERIKPGQELLVLEAMKMENVIYSDHEATIKSISIKEKDSVAVDQILIEFDK